MSYNTKGNHPFERASKSQHTHIINDQAVKDLIKQCKFPSSSKTALEDINEDSHKIPTDVSPTISTIIAVDGGYTEISVRASYPSSKIAYFQFGGLEFTTESLKSISKIPFIPPELMEQFRKIERFKLAIPTKGISIRSMSMIDSVRKPIIDFFNTDRSHETYMDTLKWLIFHEFKKVGIHKDSSLKEISFTSLPTRKNKEFKLVKVEKSSIDQKGYFFHENEQFNLIDIFRLHESIDDELGASGILGYLTNVIEHMIIVHCIKQVLQKKPSFLERFLFIKDGPLGFFGPTAQLHKDMRELCNYAISKYNLKLVGLEKSGSFVEHADQICSIKNPSLPPGHFLPLSNNYIYKHILPNPSPEEDLDKIAPYASTSYYSGKIIFHSTSESTWVLTIPTTTSNETLSLSPKSFCNLGEILNCVDMLKCDMYANSIVPIAIVNQLVSLANHPSSKMLEKFTIQTIKQS